MILKERPLEEIDDNIRDLVVSLNRIPDLHTMTNCEGHVYRDPDLTIPLKDGCVNFLRPIGLHSGLIDKMEEFCSEYDFFELEAPLSIEISKSHEGRTIVAHFEPYMDSDWNDLFEQMIPEEQEAYYERAEERKLRICEGWRDLNSLVVKYIMEKITKNIGSLPYRK